MENFSVDHSQTDKSGLCDIILADNIHVHCSDVLTLEDSLTETVEALWQAALPTNPRLFNAEILMMHSWKQDNDGTLHLFTVWGNYKMLFASRSIPALRAIVRPVGVSGIMLCSGDKRTLQDTTLVFARRSSHVASYPQHWELMPSGSISREIAQIGPSTEIDYLRQITEEFKEETGFPINIIERLAPFALIFDKQANIYDICVQLHISWTHDLVAQQFQANDEYTELACITLAQLPAFLQKHINMLVPTSITLAESFAASHTPYIHS